MKKTRFILALTLAFTFLYATVSQAWITRVKNWLIVDSEITGGSITGMTDLEVGDDITRNSYPVPTCEDAASPSAKPLIQSGINTGGAITFHREFGATPVVTCTLYDSAQGDTEIQSVVVTAKSTSGFTSKAINYVEGSFSDITSTESIMWIAVGHE